jgi:CRISPR type III-A-associated RAMP protein Csm5
MISVKIKTLTPVHIGSGRELTRDIEFLKMGEEIGIVDEKKVLSIIGEENIPLWVSMIENQKPLLEYLLDRKPNLKVEEMSSRHMPLFSNNFNRIKTLKEQLIDGMGHPLIPGSSLKGAIRTAIFNILVNKLGKNWREDELTLRYGKFSDKNIQSQIFGNDPNHDFMRFLKIGDALFKPDSLIAMSVLSMNYLFERTKLDDKFLQLTEAIAADETTTLGLKLDTAHWQKNIDMKEIKQAIPDFMLDYNSLFFAINAYTKELVQSEIEYWEEDKNLMSVENYIEELKNVLVSINKCNESEAVIRLGHGSGWIFMTGGWAKKENLVSRQLFDIIVDKTRPGNNRYHDYFFPKTRRMDEDGELLGFVKLTLV